MARKKQPPSRWKQAAAKLSENWKMLAGLGAIVSTSAVIFFGTAGFITDLRRSDPPPLASKASVMRAIQHNDRLVAQISQDVAKALQKLDHQNALQAQQQAQAQSDSSLGLCQLFVPQEAAALARVAKDPTDALARSNAALSTQFRAKYCGQALAAPAP